MGLFTSQISPHILYTLHVMGDFYDSSKQCLELDMHKVNLPNLVTTQVVRRSILTKPSIDWIFGRLIHYEI